ISAAANGATRSATISVTAQPRPADFASGAQAGSQAQGSGLMCGGIAPINGREGILYNCSAPGARRLRHRPVQHGGRPRRRRVPPAGQKFSDFCATGGPNSVSISASEIVSGDRVPASIVLEAPAGQAADREQGVPGTLDPNFNSSFFPHAGGISFPNGATSRAFRVPPSAL